MNNNQKILPRYDRQIRLAEIGIDGQEKIQNASVLVVGAGGLGCPVIQYLAACGIGKIGIVDFDTVDESNLHRQILFSVNNLGEPKVEVAKQKIQNMYPDVEINAYFNPLDNALAAELFPKYDVIIDGTDQIHTRYLINDACAIFNKPWVYGSVNGFSGQWAVFSYGEKAVQYRNLFPVPPNPESVVNCETGGTIGMVPGFVGTMQALECIKVILGMEIRPFLHTFDALMDGFYSMEIEAIPLQADNIQPSDLNSFLQFSYEKYCGVTSVSEITVAELLLLIENQKPVIVDVRNEDEMPVCNLSGTLHIPLSLIDLTNFEEPETGIIVTLCQMGERSKKAAEKLQIKYPGASIFSLKGGMNELMKSFENE